ASLRGHSRAVRCIAFSPDGTRLATGSADTSIRLWDLATGEATSVLRGHDRPVSKVCFAPDGRILASGSAGGEITLWDVTGPEGRERPGRLTHGASIRCLAFSPDGSTLASWGVSESIKLWNVATGRQCAAFPTDQCFVQALEFSADGRTLTAVSCLSG